MKNVISRLVQFVCMAAVVSAPTFAAPVITLAPRLQEPPKIHPPQLVLVDINISGLQSGELSTFLRGFQLDLHFDRTLFRLFGSPAFGGALGDVLAGEAISAVIDSPGVVTLAEVSLLEAEDLADLQADSFTLVTLGLNAFNGEFIAPTTQLLTTNTLLSDTSGNAIVGVTEALTTILVPITPSPYLVGTGLLVLIIVRRLRGEPSKCAWQMASSRG